MRFSLRLNNDVTVEQFVAIARLAERYGFDQLWVSNDLFLRSAPVLLTAAAKETERIRLGTGILNPYSIHPAEIAMMAATLQEVSEGRFLLGIGAGAEEFLGWAGIERLQPLRRTREAVEALRALLEGGKPEATSGFGWDDEAFIRVPARPTPIYIGAMSPRMRALAGEIADGVLPLLFPPEIFPDIAEEIRRGAEDAGRDANEVDVAACVWVSIDADPERARRPLAEKIAYYGPSISPDLLARLGLTPADFDQVAAALRAGSLDRAASLVTEQMLRIGIAGDPDEVTRRCGGLVEAGARHLSFGPPLGPDPEAAVTQLGERVLPEFR